MKSHNIACMFYVSESDLALIDALPAAPNGRTGRGEKVAAVVRKPYHFTERELRDLLRIAISDDRVLLSPLHVIDDVMDSLHAAVRLS